MKLTKETRKNIINNFQTVNRQSLEIYGLKLLLTRTTLVPHPDTLELIKVAESIIRKQKDVHTIADIGTGSGVIALKLAKSFPQKTIYASDISDKTLKIAKLNAVHNKILNIKFFLNKDKTWLSEYKSLDVDFIISNPPFVDDREYESKEFGSNYPEVKIEPELAIRTFDSTGITPYLAILENSSKNKTKLFLFQCNNLNIAKLASTIKKKFNCRVDILIDKSKLKRFIFVKMN